MPSNSVPPKDGGIDPAKLLAYRVLAFSQRLYRGIELVLESQLSLSVRQWRVLLFLANYGPQSVQEIARFWRYDKSQVSRAVSELLEKGLVESNASQEDGRRVIVGLTTEGRRVYDCGLPLSLARQDKLTSCLSRSELAEFERMLELLTNQADTMLSDSPSQKETAPAKRGSNEPAATISKTRVSRVKAKGPSAD